jgi:hypothetical protein
MVNGKRFGRVQNRPVSRTATQVAIKTFFNVVHRGPGIVAQQCVQRHDNACAQDQGSQMTHHKNWFGMTFLHIQTTRSRKGHGSKSSFHTGRAKPTLAAVKLGQASLHGVQRRTRAAQTLDSDHMATCQQRTADKNKKEPRVNQWMIYKRVHKRSNINDTTSSTNYHRWSTQGPSTHSPNG